MAERFTERERDTLSSIRMRRVILPIVLGIAVVIYLLYQQFDPQAFKNIEWDKHLFFWIGVSCFIIIIRHLAYSYRLRILSGRQFSWLKSIELIFIWEFSSAVSPTSVGGSAVAFFVLSQENLGTAKTASIVLYSVVLDSIFFLFSVPILLFIFGPTIIRPDMTNYIAMDAWSYTFYGAYFFMTVYAIIFFYGLFINPNSIKRLMVFFTGFGFLKRFRKDAVRLGNDFIISSGELKRQSVLYHVLAFSMTAVAWSSRFLILNCLIIAFVDTIALDPWTQGHLYSRLLAMFVIILFSPTPGGAGFVEFLFGGFLVDYVPKGIAVVVATIWRLITYYIYLLVGVIVIPNWIDKVLKRRKKASEEEE